MLDKPSITYNNFTYEDLHISFRDKKKKINSHRQFIE